MARLFSIDCPGRKCGLLHHQQRSPRLQLLLGGQMEKYWQLDSSGRISICDVENAANVHSMQLSSAVTSMTWVSEVKQDKVRQSPAFFTEQSSTFLPKLPQFPKSYTTLGKGQSEENLEDAKKLKGLDLLNILVVGLADGHLKMFAFGIVPTGVVDLGQHLPGKVGNVLSAHLSEDLHLLSVVVSAWSDNKDHVYLVSFDTLLLASRHEELSTLALKFGHILTLIMYVECTIQQMTEAWEDILLEMDSKLIKFAEEKQRLHSGTVSNDFLRLLMLGTPSDELKTFLLNELTDRGLKKLGHSIETSYSNIQKLVLKHLQSVGQAIVYHLSDVQGMSQCFDKFGVLGLSQEMIQTASRSAGSFMLKASELQQVIDGSIKNLKAFFRWLYVVMKCLSDEPVPPELTKMTQQDLNFVAQFLKENFTEDVETKKSGFKLEKVGQYLKPDDLSDPPDTMSNPWVTFLERNPEVKGSRLLYPAQPNKSLIQLHHQLKTAIDDLLQKCAVVIGESLNCVSTTLLYSHSGESRSGRRSISQFTKSDGDETYLYTMYTEDPTPCQKCYILRQLTTNQRNVEIASMRVGEIGLQDSDSLISHLRAVDYFILDISHYNQDMVSALLQENDSDEIAVLVQLPLPKLHAAIFTKLPPGGAVADVLRDLNCLDIGGHVESLHYRRLDNMKASMFAVSGSRNVACVLFSSMRRVRLFLMDVEDEEEDEDDDDAEVTDTSHNQTEGDLQTAGDEDDDEDKENSHESAMSL